MPKIKKNLSDKGFGFIEGERGDLFFHHIAVEWAHVQAADALKVFVDPGTATAEELSELLLELSTLYRMLGGSGVSFTLSQVKEPVLV